MQNEFVSFLRRRRIPRSGDTGELHSVLFSHVATAAAEVVGQKRATSLKQVVQGNSLVSVGAFESLAALLRAEAHLCQVLNLIFEGDFARVVGRPLCRLSLEGFKVTLVHLGDHCILRVI